MDSSFIFSFFAFVHKCIKSLLFSHWLFNVFEN